MTSGVGRTGAGRCRGGQPNRGSENTGLQTRALVAVSGCGDAWDLASALGGRRTFVSKIASRNLRTPPGTERSSQHGVNVVLTRMVCKYSLAWVKRAERKLASESTELRRARLVRWLEGFDVLAHRAVHGQHRGVDAASLLGRRTSGQGDRLTDCCHRG
jgi:hypothetical protein